MVSVVANLCHKEKNAACTNGQIMAKNHILTWKEKISEYHYHSF